MADVELERVGETIGHAAREIGVELVHWEFKGVGSARAILLIMIDRPEGITHEDCVAVDRRVSDDLETADVVPFAYVLEVSSPGLGKSLTGQPDFDRNRGQVVRVRAKEPVDDRLSIKGAVTLVTPKQVTLTERDGREFTIPYSNILAANTVQLPKSARRGEPSVETSDE